MKEGVLIAWDIRRHGRKVPLHTTLGNIASLAAWLQILGDMSLHGLRAPALITTSPQA